MGKISRREFLRLTASGFIGSIGKELFLKDSLFAMPSPYITIVEGRNISKATRKCVELLGGMKKFVKAGTRVVVKPNIAWNRSVEEAANTHPEVVSEIVKMCLECGAKEVIVIDHTCHNARMTYLKSGIMEAVEKAGGKIKFAKKYVKKAIPKGYKLKETEILREVVESDVLINVPVVKVHGGAKVTISMKNLMGVVKDRGKMHRIGLHESITDLSTLVKPHLIVVDASRILITRGPQGPGQVRYLYQIIAGTDPVALDAYGTKLLGKRPEDIEHIVMANRRGLGKIYIPENKIYRTRLTLWEELQKWVA
ncbi:DUF362 domain-containing protein [Candidatus Calescamantes bacterium]|nr:DUF362 domain-containing protein [Candidatus Calescamantes bacterium]